LARARFFLIEQRGGTEDDLGRTRQSRYPGREVPRGFEGEGENSMTPLKQLLDTSKSIVDILQPMTASEQRLINRFLRAIKRVEKIKNG
jgi:hypothetical protein